MSPLPDVARTALQRLWDESNALYRRRILEALPSSSDAELLDVGCDDGEWTAALARRMGLRSDQVAGIEIVDERRALALARGFDVRPADLERTWPFDDARFGVVHANQVIEHVKRLDHFVAELRRVLRPDGVAVVCTENLAAWHNATALLFGYMPFSLTNISRLGPVGNPFALHAGQEMTRDDAWQHIHVVTLDALCQIFLMHGFHIDRTFGAGYYPAWGRTGEALATRHPRRAHFIGIVARRADGADAPSVDG